MELYLNAYHHDILRKIKDDIEKRPLQGSNRKNISHCCSVIEIKNSNLYIFEGSLQENHFRQIPD